MIEAFHGKYYYVECKNNDEANTFLDSIDKEESLKNERFEICYIDGKVVVVSDCKLETFRGDKYIAWERVKRKLYSGRRKES